MPIYVLGMYCANDDEESIEVGVRRVKNILPHMCPDEAEKIKFKICEMGNYTVIDKVEAKLSPDSDTYRDVFFNLNLKNVVVADTYIKQFEKLLSGGIWFVFRMNYNWLEDGFDEYDNDAPKGGKKIKSGRLK